MLIDNWREVLVRSYTAILGFIALAAGAALTVLNLAPDGTLTPEFVAYWSPWVTYVGLAAGALVAPARVISQPTIAPKG